MSPDAQRLRQALEGRVPDQRPVDALPALFRDKPAEEAATILWEATHDLDATALGHHVFPAIRERLRTDDAVFRAMAGLVANRRINPAFRAASLNFLDRAAGERKGRRPYYDALRDVAAATSQPVVVRVAAVRSLAGDPGARTAAVLRTCLKSGRLPLVNAAAAVLCQWKDRRGKRTRVAVPGELTRLLVRYARAHSRQALSSASVGGALARLSPPSLRQLAGKARTPDQLATLLGAAGSRMDVHTLARLIRAAMRNSVPHVKSVLQGVLAVNPARLKALHDAGHYHEYLYAASLSPYHEGASAIPRLDRLCRSRDRKVAQCARSFVRTLPPAGRPETFRRACEAPGGNPAGRPT